MKHPLHKLKKKTRNIITGLFVGIAALAAVTYYLKLPADLLLRHFLSTVVFVFGIILLAVVAIVIIKLAGRLLRKLSSPERKH